MHSDKCLISKVTTLHASASILLRACLDGKQFLS